MKVFRFTLLPSFDHPIAVRIVINQDGTGILYAKMTDGKGGYDPGKISKTVERKINKDIVKEFLNVIESENFWQLPTNKEVRGLDGDQWIVEGLSDGHYHLVDRWSPEKGSVRIIGSYFLKLSGFDKFQYDKIISRFSNIIELKPRNDKAYQYRGAAYWAKGEYDKAISDFNKAIELNSKNAKAYNGKAWILATCRDAEYRDGAKAVELAKRAVEISPEGNFFDTLAAAYAEDGKFEDAITTQEKAIDLLKKEGQPKIMIDQGMKQLKSFKAHKPWREK